MDIADQGAVQQRFCLCPELVTGFSIAFGIGNQGSDQLQNILFGVDIRKGIVVHGLFEVDGVEDFDAVLVPQECIAALDYDTSLGERFVKT